MLDKIFIDVGKKIKKLSKLFFMIGAIGSLAIGTLVIVSGVFEILWGFFEILIKIFDYFSDYGLALIGSGILTIIIGVLSGAAGVVVSFILSLLMYGFGELVDKTTALEQHMRTVHNIPQELDDKAAKEAKEEAPVLEATEEKEEVKDDTQKEI